MDAIAGVTLAAYAIPVSLAYAALAGLPPQIGVYGYMLGGIGYALLGASRQLAVGPTSAISLMIAATVGALAGWRCCERYAQIASLAAFGVAVLCLIAWLFKLSVLVRLVSDSILVGFKAGAGLTIIMSQLPSLFGVAGGGHNFFDRAIKLIGQLGDISIRSCWRSARSRCCCCCSANGFCRASRSASPSWRCRSWWRRCSVFRPWVCPLPGRYRKDCRRWGCRPSACWNSTICFRSRPAACCWPTSKVSRRPGASPPSTAIRLDVRQEFLGLGAANLAVAFGHGYPVAGGLVAIRRQ